ncbi:hypothetical protein OSB04_un001733 [Centaurea solstitialis]|uniref:Tf2-1-like SH3-like domain-containing protein n=1 Tax=Centaurea solstitialis TaxID=347529 RepID=A0AA38SFM8_9ASTR|nr:hypothetical protein OSB04_un001733 [Centaurea solstitialis]
MNSLGFRDLALGDDVVQGYAIELMTCYAKVEMLIFWGTNELLRVLVRVDRREFSCFSDIVHDEKLGKTFSIIERVGEAVNKLELPEVLRSIHNTFLVSNLRKGVTIECSTIPLKNVQVEEKLKYIEEPEMILGRKIRNLRKRGNRPRKGALEISHKSSLYIGK